MCVMGKVAAILVAAITSARATTSERARRRARRRGGCHVRTRVSRSGPDLPRRHILPLLLLPRLPTVGVTRGHTGTHSQASPAAA
eukprot:6249611-Prymnesium_polylepis.1